MQTYHRSQTALSDWDCHHEIANTLTHLLGLLLAIGAWYSLFQAIQSTPRTLETQITCMIFGFCLTLTYLTSVLYHSFYHTRFRQFFKICDLSAIFLFIAASYTPLTLAFLPIALAQTLICLEWSIAIAGVTYLILTKGKHCKRKTTLLYLAMGWLAIVAIKPLYLEMPQGAFELLLIGGGSYTLGVVFYAMPRMPFNHAIWHVFVLLGSFSHVFLILQYVA